MKNHLETIFFPFIQRFLKNTHFKEKLYQTKKKTFSKDKNE
jgi:hypothetical protein